MALFVSRPGGFTVCYIKRKFLSAAVADAIVRWIMAEGIEASERTKRERKLQLFQAVPSDLWNKLLSILLEQYTSPCQLRYFTAYYVCFCKVQLRKDGGAIGSYCQLATCLSCQLLPSKYKKLHTITYRVAIMMLLTSFATFSFSANSTHLDYLYRF